MKYKLGIIGTGVMGNAIIDRVIENNVIAPSMITAFDIDSSKLDAMKEKGITPSYKLQDMLDNTEMVLLSIKPQHYSSLSVNNFEKVSTILSIMAGVKVNSIRKTLNISCGIARIMPNTPCKVGKGFSGIYFDNVSTDYKQLIIEMFSACGEVSVISEDMFDAVTSISGSGPAYVYMFINAMIQGGIKGGLSDADAKKMAVATLSGATELAKQSSEAMDILVERVCSKGGTTIEAVNIYREKGLEEIVIEGIDACRNRSIELSRN